MSLWERIPGTSFVLSSVASNLVQEEPISIYLYSLVTFTAVFSIWYGAAIRGDVNKITIGDNSSIGDRAVVHVAKIAADYPTVIGNNVTVGPGSIIHACTLKDNCIVGAASTILDGAIVESQAIVAPGSLVTAKTVVKSKTLYAGSPAKVRT
jgi:carbonic anhydrase/acetyltransferase-like protein (isoleucine patch superfamily)